MLVAGIKIKNQDNYDQIPQYQFCVNIVGMTIGTFHKILTQ